MKTQYTKLIKTVLLVISITGCQKLDENAKASLTSQNFFNTQSDLTAGVSAMYVPLTPAFGAFSVIEGFLPCFGSDDLATDPGLNKGGYRQYDQLVGSATNDRVAAAWNPSWKTIYQANNLLANYNKVNTTDALKAQAAGQAFFLRGFCYFHLVRLWGALPVITVNLSPEARPNRQPIAEVYSQIILDLQNAINSLPAVWTGNDTGRPTANAARALLAQVYLTMAGYPLKQVDKYALAAQLENTILQSNQFHLLANYADVFKSTNNNGAESVWAIQFSTANAGSNSNNIYGSSCVPTEEPSGFGDYFPEINFYLNYPAGPRKDAVFYTTLKVKQPDGSFKKIDWTQSSTGHPYYNKFRLAGVVEDANSIISVTYLTDKALDMIRYPDVLLTFAEATAMSTGVNQAAYDAVNSVRRRAGLPDLPTGLSNTAFRDAVVNERAWEFAGEVGTRWFDMIRLELVESVAAARNPKENAIPVGTNLRNKYLAAIPDYEMRLNPQWIQNPGY